MPKVSIRTLDSVTHNDTTATTLINENFAALQEAIENTVSRDGSTPNFMDANLDLNSYKIINAGDPENDHDVITKGWFDQFVEDASTAASTANAAAERAASSAQSALVSAQTAGASADLAHAEADLAEDWKDLAKDWATKTDGTVDGVDYSSKYYAQQILPLADNIAAVVANEQNITAVAENETNITAVAENETNINAVAANEANINAVSDDLTNIDNVAGDLTKINAVADDLTNIDSVADDLTNIDAVASNETNINTTSANIASITSVAGNTSNINAVADNETNINTVAGISSDVSTTASIASDVSAVADNNTDISAVADDLTNIDTVATDITNVNATGSNIANVNAVADNETNINAVNANKTNIDTVATNIADINAVAADLANIDAAPTYAAEAKQWAIGVPSEPSEGSAKYWAGQAAAGQINSDWTEADTTSKAYILNKPNLATVATSGSYNDLLNKPTIPAAQIQSDWTQADNTKLDYIKNKPTLGTMAAESASDYIKTSGLATVATSGSYTDLNNKPTLGTMAAESASDYTKSANLAAVATSGAYSDLSGQPTKLTDFTNDLPIKEGIPVSIITDKKISINGSSVSLYWEDPADTIIDGFVLASWKSTTIVKKQGSAPENVSDGTVVVTVTTRNQYANTPYVDIQDNADQWYYRAFPLSVNGVYSLDKRNVFGTVLFGYRINKTDPVPGTRVEYLPYCDNYFYDPCVMNFAEDKFYWGSWEKAFFIPKPCLLSTSGVVTYYLDPNNFNYQADGVTASNVTSNTVNGNFMVEFPSIFVKVWDDNNYVYCLVSNQKLDDDFECWATKQSDGTYADNFYLPMFEGTVVSSVMRSYASNGKPTASTTAENEATYATANGTGWNTTTWADEMLMMLLFPLLFKSTDSQGTLGYGGTASSSALTVNNDAAITKGMMYGTSGASSYGVTYLGMHNWWGHRWRRPNGLMNANGNYMFKMTHSTIDGSTTTGYNRTASGYISSGVTPPAASSSYINYYQPIGKYGIVPEITSGSATTYYCDGMWTNNGHLDQLFLGGHVDGGAIGGVFCFDVSGLPSHSAWCIGGSLSYHTL